MSLLRGAREYAGHRMAGSGIWPAGEFGALSHERVPLSMDSVLRAGACMAESASWLSLCGESRPCRRPSLLNGVARND